ncbi:MAG: fibronectin type III domain-containing protein [Candidatus Andersenbacteria bacterium]
MDKVHHHRDQGIQSVTAGNNFGGSNLISQAPETGRATGQRSARTRKVLIFVSSLVVASGLLWVGATPVAYAAVITWDGGGTDGTCGGGAGDGNKWSCGANWSGDVAPGSTDVATFDGTSTKDATIDAAISVSGIDINTGYTGTITQATGVTVTFDIGNYDQAAGTFTGGNSLISGGNTGSFTLSGGTFTNSSGGLTLERNFTYSGGTFTNTGKIVTFADSTAADDTTLTCSGTLEGTVVITKDGLGDFTLASGCTIDLGANPTTAVDIGANNPFTNNGTITIPSGTWTINGGTLTNNGTITHSGSGWDGEAGLINNTGATITYSGTTLSFERIFTQSGTFALTGKTITFDGNAAADDTTLTCSGTLGGTVVISKNNNGDFIVASGCSIDLGATPTTAFGTGTYTNNGTITIPSGTWTINGATSTLTNAGTITHSGSGWDFNDTGLTNNSGATITYSGTAITMERSLTQSGTFDLTGKTITFDDTNSTDDSTVTCSGTLGGTVVVTKNSDGDFINSSGCSIDLGASPTTTISSLATNGFHNHGTITIPSGTWTFTGVGNAPELGNFGTITHSGSGWDMNDAQLTNLAGATITYSGTALSIERSFTQNGTFDLTGKTVTLDGADDADDATLRCSSTLAGSIVVNKTHASGNTTLGSNCTIAGSFTRTDGPVTNPASAFTLTIQGDFSMSTTDTFGGANLTLTLGGGNNQTVTQNAGDIAGPLTVNKSGNTATLATALTTGSTCTIVEGIFDVAGNSFACGSTFTVEDGGTLKLQGGETTLTTPSTSSGSTVIYNGTASYTGLKAGNSYHHLTFDGSGGTWTMNAALDVNGNLTLTSGTLASGGNNITLAGNWTNTAAYTHGSNTVTLDGGDQTLAGPTTFNNLTKTVSTARTLTFPTGSSNKQTIAGTLTLQGASGALLSLRSASTGTQWQFDPQGTRTLFFLDVKDSHNTNSTSIATAGLNITDSGNNTGWSFNPEPPSNFAGSAISSTAITWTWTDNATDETGFKLLDSAGTVIATINTANTTSYTETGLTRGTSYSRKLIAFNGAGESAATSTVTVTTLTSPPTAPELRSPSNEALLNTNLPTFSWNKSTDNDDGMATYTLTLGSLVLSGIPASGSSASDPGSKTHVATSYTAQYFNENDGNPDNDYIALTLKDSDRTDLPLANAEHSWSVTAVDTAGNTKASATQSFVVDTQAPTIGAPVFPPDTTHQQGVYYLVNTLPTISYSVRDGHALHQVVVTLSRAETRFGGTTTYTVIQSSRYTLSGNTATVAFTPQVPLIVGTTYQLTLLVTDAAGNSSEQKVIFTVITPSDQARQEIAELDAETTPVDTIIEKLRDLLPDAPFNLSELQAHALLRHHKQADNLATFWQELLQNPLVAWLVERGSVFERSLLTSIDITQSWWQRLLALAVRLAVAIGTTIRDTSIAVVNQGATTLDRLALETTTAQQLVRLQMAQGIAHLGTLVTPLTPTVGQPLQQVGENLARSPDIGQGYRQERETARQHVSRINTQLQALGNSFQVSWETGKETRVRTGLKNRQRLGSGLTRLINPTKNTARRLALSTRQFYETMFDYRTANNITNVRISALTPTSVVVEWNTNHLTRSSKVNYGPSLSYGQSVTRNEVTDHHRLELVDLKPHTTYYFEIMNQNGTYVFDAYYALTTPSETEELSPRSFVPQDIIITSADPVAILAEPHPEAMTIFIAEPGKRYRALTAQDGWLSLLLPSGQQGWLPAEQGQLTDAATGSSQGQYPTQPE